MTEYEKGAVLECLLKFGRDVHPVESVGKMRKKGSHGEFVVISLTVYPKARHKQHDYSLSKIHSVHGYIITMYFVNIRRIKTSRSPRFP